MTPRLRLLKVIVQPIFVIDDGNTLTEYASAPVDVSPQEWPTFAKDRFAQGMEALRRQIESPSSSDTP